MKSPKLFPENVFSYGVFLLCNKTQPKTLFTSVIYIVCRIFFRAAGGGRRRRRRPLSVITKFYETFKILQDQKKLNALKPAEVYQLCTNNSNEKEKSYAYGRRNIPSKFTAKANKPMEFISQMHQALAKSCGFIGLLSGVSQVIYCPCMQISEAVGGAREARLYKRRSLWPWLVGRGGRGKDRESVRRELRGEG